LVTERTEQASPALSTFSDKFWMNESNWGIHGCTRNTQKQKALSKNI
jgi:hypothetical protein